MTLLMTSERCPECGQIIFMVVYPKLDDMSTPITSQLLWRGFPHTIADGCYLERDSTLVIVQFDQDTLAPDYYCLHCQWES
jgi:hypothetical protein